MSKYVRIAPRLHPENHHIAVEARSPVKVLEQTFFPTDADDLVQSYKLCSNLIALLRGLPYRLTQTSAQTRVVLFTSNQSIGRAQKTRRLLCPVPHRIPSDAEKTSDTWDIAISAKQRNFVSPIKNSRLM